MLAIALLWFCYQDILLTARTTSKTKTFLYYSVSPLQVQWIGLDWVNQLVDWVGLDLAKWTHAQLWFSLNICFGRRFIVVFILIYTFHDVAKYCHSFIHSFIHSTRRHQHDSKRTGIND